MTPPNPRGPHRPSKGKHSGQGKPAGKGRATGAGKAKRPTSGTTRPSQPTAVPQWPDRPTVDVHDPDGVRLQKLLAAAGVGSRRVCENLITQGRVEVDGQVVTELGVVTSMSDDLGRVDIGDFVANRKERLFHVGRLDADTEGLLILTNDGELAHRLQHPRYGVLKTYLAQIQGQVPRDLGRRLREGVMLEDGPVKVDSFRVVDSAPGKALVEVVLHEGRKHIVRRMLAEAGHPVLTLVRTKVGPIHLGDTKPGKWRNLTSTEVGLLYKAAEL